MSTVRIPIEDTICTGDPLTQLRDRLNEIPDISNAHFRMRNSVERVGDAFWIRDFVIEIDTSAEKSLRKALEESKFHIRPKKPLYDRPGVLQSVRDLAKQHQVSNPRNPMSYAVWFRLEATENIHLLEICPGLLDPGDGSLEGISIPVGDIIRDARNVVIYLCSPAELHKAFEVNPSHPAIENMLYNQFELVYPLECGTSERLHHEFPEIGSKVR